MPVDDYIAGVLAGFKSAETLKAMAVTARTYVTQDLQRCHR